MPRLRAWRQLGLDLLILRLTSYSVPSVSRVDRTSAISFGSSLKCRMWCGDSICNLFASRGDDLTALNLDLFSSCMRRRLVDGCPKNAELFDPLLELSEIHG